MIIRTANKHKDPSTANQVDGFSDEPNAVIRGQAAYELKKLDEGVYLVIYERETRDATGVLMVERTTLKLFDVIEEREVTVQPKAAKNVKAKPRTPTQIVQDAS